MINLIKFLALVALLFYVLCWFTHQSKKLLWYIGINLSWFSLILSISVHFFVTSDEDHTGTCWAYTYGYDQLDQCSLFGCVWESKIDDNETAPTVWDGEDIITSNTQDWKLVSGDDEVWVMNKVKGLNKK